jgi:superfamily II DNA or RNA helicase
MGCTWALQKPPSSSGAIRVIARGWPWTRTGAVSCGAVTCVHLARGASDAPDLDTLLEPFDRVLAVGAPQRARKVSTSWLQAFVAAWPSIAWPAQPVAAPIDLPINLLPHQLAPVSAVVRGAASRLLLADVVGQGKTIEAGLILRELTARGAADRVLILTPLTLRDQWRAELGSRCRLEAEVIDRATLAARERETASGVGPFQAPGIVLLSTDLAKQPDVLARLAAVCWDVLVIDEAHAVSGNSARAAAASALGARSRLVLLLTATPHSGDADAYHRLCTTGRLDGEGPPLLFRHVPDRQGRRWRPRHRDLRVPRSTEERACAAALGRYVRRLDQAGTAESRLIAIVLRKRALSSPAALAASLRHRMAWLDRQPAPAEQPGLPFDEEETERSDTEQPRILLESGLADGRAEGALLRTALDAAKRAVATWSKRDLLQRLLRRTSERVLVFTEYRDTLLALSAALAAEVPVAMLHGGLGRADRASALARFANGQARVLLATDVAAEGLNLQVCRLVVHVELPWSPARLEQRNGRVDRLGQRRRVHVWRLLGDPLHESRVIEALSARLARIQAAGLEGSFSSGTTMGPGHEPTGLPDRGLLQAGGDDTAERLTEDAARLRHLVAACGRARNTHGVWSAPPTLAWRRVRRCHDGLPRGVTIVCLLPSSVRGMRPTLVPVHVALSRCPPGSPSRWLPEVAPAAVSMAATTRQAGGLIDRLRAREHALLARAEADASRAAARWQGSLFERRTARIVEAARADATARTQLHQRRLAELAEDVDAGGAIAVLALLVD